MTRPPQIRDLVENPTVELSKTVRTDDLAPFNPKLADDGKRYIKHPVRKWAQSHSPEFLKVMFEQGSSSENQ
jgi:hypothetical protein